MNGFNHLVRPKAHLWATEFHAKYVVNIRSTSFSCSESFAEQLHWVTQISSVIETGKQLSLFSFSRLSTIFYTSIISPPNLLYFTFLFETKSLKCLKLFSAYGLRYHFCSTYCADCISATKNTMRKYESRLSEETPAWCSQITTTFQGTIVDLPCLKTV